MENTILLQVISLVSLIKEEYKNIKDLVKVDLNCYSSYLDLLYMHAHTCMHTCTCLHTYAVFMIFMLSMDGYTHRHAISTQLIFYVF